MSIPGAGRLASLREAARGSLGVVPGVAVVFAVVAGVLLSELDRQGTGGEFSFATFTGGPDAARSVLSAIAGSVITVMSLTFSLTVVALQLSSSQFSPRLLRTFVRDRTTKVVLAVFLGTFVYCLTVLRNVVSENANHAAFVPRLAVTVSLFLAFASAVSLVVFFAHITSKIRVDTLMRDVHVEAAAAMREMFPVEHDGDGSRAPKAPLAGQVRTLVAPQSGWLQALDTTLLVRAAREHGVVLRLDVQIGMHVLSDSPIGVAWAADGQTPRLDSELVERVGDALVIGFERTPQQDMAFGLRQLVDIAAKALSPGVNDPTTAVHAIGHLTALLCDLARRPLGPLVLDIDATPRVVVARPEFGQLLDLACGQPRRYGADEPAVVLALLDLLTECARRTQHEHRDELIRNQLDLLIDAAEAETKQAADLQPVYAAAERVRAAIGRRVLTA